MLRFLLLLWTLSATAFSQSRPSLSIAWFEWQPCQALKAVAATYPDANVTVTCFPNSGWRHSIFSAFADQRGADLGVRRVSAGQRQDVRSGRAGGHASADLP